MSEAKNGLTENQKGIFHLFLALAATLEVLTSKSKQRTLLLGCMAGWHAVLAVEHFTDTEGNALAQLTRTRSAGL